MAACCVEIKLQAPGAIDAMLSQPNSLVGIHSGAPRHVKHAHKAKKPDALPVAKVPSIEEVVAAEGFVPTPSQSEIYKPGAVLVPYDRKRFDALAALAAAAVVARSAACAVLMPTPTIDGR